MNNHTITQEEYNAQTSDTLCARNKFKLQRHQLFLKDYVRSSAFDEHRRILLYHGLGSGKTCSAISLIRAMNVHRPKVKCMMITPASLINNVYKEMLSECGTQQYLKMKKFKASSKSCTFSGYSTDMIKTVNKYFHVMSYQAFVKNIKKISKNTLLIVDEVQNMISETGSMYKHLFKVLQECKECHVVFLSGTPIFDKPNEIALLGNLLEPNRSKHLPIKNNQFMSMFMKTDGKNVVMRNQDKLTKFFSNKISYFRGSNPVAYPSKAEYIAYCPMSTFQYKAYQNSVGDEEFTSDYDEVSRAFLVGPRQVSNVIYPDGTTSRGSAEKYNNIKFSSKKHACKMYYCAKNAMSLDGPGFVYSNFVTSCGINTFAGILENEFNFRQVQENECPVRSSVFRYAVFKTGQSQENTRLLQIFNSPENKDGKIIKLILGSPAMKEGVTLLRTRHVHLLDPYWNRSRTEQIIGRAVRFCSHNDLPRGERHVDVYHYVSVNRKDISEFNVNPEMLNMEERTVDLHVLHMAAHKQKINIQFENILKQIAFDCSFFKVINKIECKQQVPNNNKPNNNKPNTNKPNTNKPNTNKPNNNKPNNNKLANNVSVVSIVKPRKKMEFSKKSKLISVSKKTIGSSCPITRRPDPNCPSTHPFKRVNRKGHECCFKHDKKDNTCIKRLKSKLIQEAIDKGVYKSGPITKKKLCDLLITV